MPTMTLNFNEKIQTSVQVGDMILYSNPSTVGGFSTSSQSDVVMLGACLTIASNRLSMTVDYQTGTAFPTSSSFILFSKDKYSNPNGLLGYFAKVCFKNDSKTEAELFSVGAGVFESSK